MANMSYCMLENTVKDMEDCINELEINDFDYEKMINESSSKSEKKAIKKFVELCEMVADEVR
jgi:hypothetical protein